MTAAHLRSACLTRAAVGWIALGLAACAPAAVPSPQTPARLDLPPGAPWNVPPPVVSTRAEKPPPAPSANTADSTQARPSAATHTWPQISDPGGGSLALWRAQERQALTEEPREQGIPTRPSRRAAERARTSMLYAGVGVFLGFWALSGLTVATQLGTDVKDPWVGLFPIFGPLYIAADPQFMSRDPDRVVLIGLLAIESVGQLIGTTLLIGGSIPRNVEVRDRSAAAKEGPFFRLDARGPALVF